MKIIKILSSTVNFVTLKSIKSYQKLISPHKGWKCAYATIYGGVSCSNYGLSVIELYGLIHGAALLKERFKECSKASATYKSYMASVGLASGSNFMDIPPEVIELLNNDLYKVGFCHDVGSGIHECCRGIITGDDKPKS